MELELVSYSKALATAKTAEGKIVNFGYKKSANVLLGLAGKPIGTKFNAEIAVSSTTGNLYNTDTLDLQEAYFRAESMVKKAQILDKQLAKFSEL